MKRDLAIGWALSGLVILFLAMDAGGKLIAPAAMIAYSPPLGIPPDVGLYRELGLILALGTILYAVPRTAVLGAILLTGYLGGAVAMHFRVGSPLFSHTLFGVYLGVIAWGGLWFRDPRVRALIPIAG
ncbi:MAG: DoxX family protein [Sphingomonas sp.]|uniref:DoxX family protein n=1 Tax=unclassified Sphingomonas TaxID=196159 RepID=UPI0024564EC0|nr:MULTISPECIES: DoxX family protein [unclassified Sphingomonas]MBQ1500628.1 DoxX family protein [Sphingomonas sp.]MDH4744269.1 DoxX family protein [Sphingomonas sp. CBMAI 2297]